LAPNVAALADIHPAIEVREMTPRVRPRNGWSAIAALLAGALVYAAMGVATAQESADESYPVSFDPDFESSLSLEQVEQIALTTLAAPLSAVSRDTRSGELQLEPPLPKILQVAGCRGADLPSIEPRLGQEDIDFIWFVRARGSFTMPHEGRMDNREGFLLIHPESGFAFGIGVFPESER